jgi:ribonuclease-3
MRAEALTRLEEALEHGFDDRDHLEHALVHRSYCAEHPETESNERMEFLGDAVLGLAVTVHVFHAYPELPEGELAKIRASVVNAEVLAGVASKIQLGAALMLGKGEDASGGRSKPSILADEIGRAHV